MVQLQGQQSKPKFGKSLLIATLLMSFVSLTSASYVGEAQASQIYKPKGSTWTKLRVQQKDENNRFRLEQDTSTYDDYVPLKVPYTQTDNYLKLDSFLIGLKLDDWYTNSTNCIDNFVYTIDDKDYFSNNRTLYRGKNESWISPWLNFTGLVGSHFASSLPYCYQFYTSVKLTETERFNSYNGWGEIMIAFLFNQMGNALEFQQKFENIKLDKETQNYQGVWMEYGDLVHIIWDFQQLEAGARESFDEWLTLYFPDPNANMTDDSEAYIVRTALERFADYVDNRAANISVQVNKTQEVVEQKRLQATNQFNMPTDAYRLLYGFLNGATDVFDIGSLPDLCRDNVTETKQVSTDLFVNNRYVLPDENLEFITAFSELLTNPYGLSFSCLFAAQQVFTVRRKKSDTTGMTEEEIFANNLMIVNDVVTNVVFNLGYLYQDVVSYISLDPLNLNYWSRAGNYAGDFVMRFWYRKSFSNEFQFDYVESCDTTNPDVNCLE